MTHKNDIGDWEYEESLEGYGHPVEHVWVNNKIDGVAKIALSEGMHIMKCDRGEWLLAITIGAGGVDENHCFETEDEALDNIEDLLPSN